ALPKIDPYPANVPSSPTSLRSRSKSLVCILGGLLLGRQGRHVANRLAGHLHGDRDVLHLHAWDIAPFHRRQPLATAHLVDGGPAVAQARLVEGCSPLAVAAQKAL